MVRLVVFVVFIFSCSASLLSQSVLATGDHYKIGVVESGVYKMDKNFLNLLGLTTTGIDPRNIHLFGNHVQGALPQKNSEERPFDLSENAIKVVGATDGSFDNEDYILFYATGPDKKRWSSDGFEYEKNIYSDTAYYFLSVDENAGLRISKSKDIDASTAQTTITTYNDAIVNEKDVLNIISSGRLWVDNTLSNGESQSYSYLLDGIVSDIELTATFLNRSSDIGEFQLIANGASIGTVSLPEIRTGTGTTYFVKGRYGRNTFSIPRSETLDLSIRFTTDGSTRRGHLDNFILTFDRELAFNGVETYFRNIATASSTTKYLVADATSATSVWNLSDPYQVKEHQIVREGNNLVFVSEATTVEEFVVFDEGAISSPFLFGKVPNQNIKAGTNVEGLIVTTSAFLPAAQQLADFHRSYDQLAVKVVILREIYNEFSSGRSDISAIRDYAKYVYENGQRLKYLLLFGDCSYDYKDRVVNNTNFIPTYQSRESLNPVSTYSSDDYFGFFDEEEGEWKEVDSLEGNHTMEIGIGRLPAKNLPEARVMVEKIIRYNTNPLSLGKWKNDITYVSDDGDNSAHAIDAESLSQIIDQEYPKYKINKLLLDIYEQIELGASREISPDAQAAFEAKIREGTFLVNFMGHGDETQWMDERLLTKDIIANLNNRNKLPIFVTATCEFGRYDNPIFDSGAEDLILNENGGAIALLTTSRPVFRFSNFDLNRAFHRHMFRKENGHHLRLGDIIRQTKNGSLRGSNNRNFTLLGDPMMMPAFPKQTLIMENNQQFDTLSALEKVSVKGYVAANGTMDDSFNGIMDISIRDIPQEFLTLGQESDPFTYTKRSNVIFKGQANVTAGRFQFTFVVPKNISYRFETGRISLYAQDNSRGVDASGESKEILIGGTASVSETDNRPPSIFMYLNHPSFQSGASVGNSPLLIADIADENGITTASSGVVDGISLVLDNEVISLNEFYTSAVDDFTKGTVIYPISNLDPGTYSATLRVWDTHNNVAKSAIFFSVSAEPLIKIFDMKVYPNPVVDKTNFSFSHDRSGEDLLVDLIVYSSAGKNVLSNKYFLQNTEREVEIAWEPRTDAGDLLETGIYFYRIAIMSRSDGVSNELSGRLLIK